MDENYELLRAIFLQRDDDAPWLIYADWLDERGDLRGEAIRLMVERRRTHSRDARHTALEIRLRELSTMVEPRWFERLSHLAELSPEFVTDLVLVHEGRGAIEVRGGEPDTVLLVEGKPIAMNWDDCQGSVGQYLVFTGHPAGHEHAHALAEFVSGERAITRPLGDELAPLLAQFASGVYSLALAPSEVVLDVGYWEAGTEPLIEYYPMDDRILVLTQSRYNMDSSRVVHFRERIRAGKRPIVLTASAENAWCEFVIDGHHKWEAYHQARVMPTILEISRWDSPAIGLDEGLRYFPRGHRGRRAYRDSKRRGS